MSRLFTWWRRPARRPELRSYFTAAFAAEPFVEEGIAAAPSSPGVYLLYRSGRLIYVGMAPAGIREELWRHRSGVYGECTQAATAFDYEVTGYPEQVQREYLRAHMARYGGRLPPCNQSR
jgi:hypothetical protein